MGDAFKQGLGLGAGLSVFNAAKQVVGDVVGGLNDLVKAGENAQATDAKLAAALKANVPDWQAHTAEIDAAVKAGNALGFTNDEQKNSLALLVVRTHDVTAALRIQRAAMDLARLKGIDLGTATIAVGKAYSGSTTALQRMGIQIDKGVKGFDAIAKIEQAAGGQAVAYSKTAVGAQAALDASLEGFKEKVGTYLIGPFTDLINFISGPVLVTIGKLIDGLGNIGDAFNNLHRAIDPNFAAVQDQDKALVDLAGTLGISSDALIAGADRQRHYADALAATTHEQGRQLVIADLLAKQQANQSVNADELAQKYAAYGITAGEVAAMNSDVLNGTLTLTNAQNDNTAAIHGGLLAAAPYLTALALQRTQLLLNAGATGNATTADHLLAAAFGDVNTTLEPTTRVVKGTGAAVSGLGLVVRNLVAQKDPLLSFADTFGGVVSDIKNSTSSGKTDLRNYEAVWRGAALNIPRAIDTIGIQSHASFKTLLASNKADLKQLIHDINHPGDDKKLMEWLPKAMTKAQTALQTAETSGDAIAIAEAKALVDKLNAEWALLHGTITIRTSVNTQPFTGEGTGTGTPGQGGHALASGGPTSPYGTYLVGEKGPELLQMGSQGGFVANHGQLLQLASMAAASVYGGAGAAGTGALNVHHTFGPIRVDGDISPAAAHEVGLGVGEGIASAMSTAHLRPIAMRRYG